MTEAEQTQEKMLRKVRALLAKANSTEFEAERQTFLASADSLMEKYAIDRVLAMQKADPKVKLIVRKDMDFSWWRDLKGIDYDARNEIYWLFNSCVIHCRCVTATATINWGENTVAVYGTESDLAYLDLLFTDLFMQMSQKLKPTFNPDAEIGSQVRIAKEAGMTWDQILDWSGLRDDPLGKRLLPAYRKYCTAHGLTQVKVNPKTFQYSYVQAFCSTISSRLRKMRADRPEPTEGSMALALRDIRQQARDSMWDDFPELRPHPDNCQCSACKNSRKPVKYRSRTASDAGTAMGYRAGNDARIVTKDGGLKTQKELR